jgi:hypothetical protein
MSYFTIYYIFSNFKKFYLTKQKEKFEGSTSDGGEIVDRYFCIKLSVTFLDENELFIWNFIKDEPDTILKWIVEYLI